MSPPRRSSRSVSACAADLGHDRLVRHVLFAVVVATACQNDPTPRKPAGKLEVLPAPEGDVAALVAPELARAQKDGKRLVVYVGATWCEPCVEFHEAAKAGRLDDKLGDVRMIEFDLDRDARRLDAAAYRSEFIPLFALPGADGRATGKQAEGAEQRSIPYLEQIVPKIRALVGG